MINVRKPATVSRAAVATCFMLFHFFEIPVQSNHERQEL